MPATILIQDPYHDYAARFIELFHRRFGFRSVCFYTNAAERSRHARNFPVLSSNLVAAAYDVRPDRLADFANYCRSHYQIAAIVPFNEPTLLNAVELARRLSLSWAQPAVMRRFRDKFALKEHLRKRQPTLRLNASREVATLADINDARRLDAFRRFVVKPNAGFGNRSIGLFDSATDDATVQAFIERAQGQALVMEEFVDGTECFVNGQMDGKGNVMVLAVFEYSRRPANGRHNIDFETRRVAHHEPAFAAIAEYTRQVMQASELLRCPFHLELKIDARGPCLIEVGARLAGHQNAVLCSELHRDVDLIDLAAHYYLQEEEYGPLRLNWDRYDSGAVRYVHGVASRRERIYTLRGLREVEAMPAFMAWVRQPTVGGIVDVTTDSLTMPWSLVIKAASETDVAAAAEQIRNMLVWNVGLHPLARLSVGMATAWRRYSTAVRVRILSLLAASADSYRAIPVRPTLSTALADCRRLLARSVDAIIYRLQLRGVGAQSKSGAANDDTSRATEVVRWAEQYLAKPHPLLGRKGPICPFVQHTIDRGTFAVRFCDAIDGQSLRQLRRAILDAATDFSAEYPRTSHKGLFSSLVIVLPNLSKNKLSLLDRVHDELKTYFMQRDLMCSPFHPDCTKPSIVNPEFEVFKAPFAGVAIRHMDVRDIAFLGHNRDAFLRYRERFAEQFTNGKVSNEYGYVDMYLQACARFAVTP